MCQAAIENGDIPVRLVGVDGPRLHGAVGMFGDDVAASLDIGADQGSLKLAGEAQSLSQHRKRLPWCYTHHDVAICLVFRVFRHRLITLLVPAQQSSYRSTSHRGSGRDRDVSISHACGGDQSLVGAKIFGRRIDS